MKTLCWVCTDQRPHNKQISQNRKSCISQFLSEWIRRHQQKKLEQESAPLCNGPQTCCTNDKQGKMGCHTFSKLILYLVISRFDGLQTLISHLLKFEKFTSLINSVLFHPSSGKTREL